MIAQNNSRTGHVAPVLHCFHMLHCAASFLPKFTHFPGSDIWTHLIRNFPWPTPPTTQTAFRLNQPFFHSTRSLPTDRPTERTRKSTSTSMPLTLRRGLKLKFHGTISAYIADILARILADTSDTHDLLRTFSHECHEDATRKTASVEFKLHTV